MIAIIKRLHSQVYTQVSALWESISKNTPQIVCSGANVFYQITLLEDYSTSIQMHSTTLLTLPCTKLSY